MRPSRFRPSYSEVIGEGGVSTIGELSRGGSNRMPVLMTATVGAAFLSLSLSTSHRTVTVKIAIG